jgi:hypothetical protein
MKKYDLRIKLTLPLLSMLACILITGSLSAQTTYYWVGGASGSLSQSYTAGTAPWSNSYGGTAIATALTLDNTDTLVFDGGNIGGGATGTVTVTPTFSSFALTSTAVATGTSGSQTAFANATFAATTGVAVGQYVTAGNSLLGGTFVSNLTATTVTFSGYEAGLTTPATTFTFTSITVGGIKVTGKANVTIATPTNTGGAIVTTYLDLGTPLVSGSDSAGCVLNDGGNEIMVNNGITGTPAGVHQGLGRIRMVKNVSPDGQIAGGVTLGNLYIDGIQRVDAVSNITVSNDLILRGINTYFFGGGYVTITVGGNVYSGIVGASNPANKGTKSVVGNDPGPGTLVLTSTSTISGAITAAVTTAGSGYTSTTGSYAFTLPSPTGGIGATVLLTVTGGTIATTPASVIILDPGTGYPAGDTVTATVPGGTAVVTLTTAGVSNKYLAIGQDNLEVWGNLELADANNGNIYIGAPLNTSRALYISKNLTFMSSVDTTGKLIISSAAAGQGSPNALGIGNNINGTQQNFTIVMGPKNAIGVQYANTGKILFGSNAPSGFNSGTVYFDQSNPGVTNSIQNIQYYRGNFTLGNTLIASSTYALGGGTGTVALGTIQYGTFKIGAGANLNLPSTLTFGSPAATGGYAIDASDPNATVTFNGTTIPVANAQTYSAGLFYPASIGNLVNATGTSAINQSISITNTLTLPSTTTLKIGTGDTLGLSASITGTGVLNASPATVIMNGTQTQTANLTSASNLTINNSTGVIASPSVSGLLTITSGDVSSYANISNCNVLFNGSVPQSVNAGLTSVNAFTINNAQGITLNSPLSVNGALSLTSGKIALGNNNLKVWSTGSIVAPSPATSYLVTNGTGNLVMTPASGAVTTFPVGTTATYNPVTLTPDSTSDFYVSVAIGNTPALPTTNAAILPLESLDRTWSITPNTPSVTAITLGYDGTTDNNTSFNNSGTNVALLENAGGTSPWQYVGTGSVIPGAGVGTAKTASFTDVTSFSSFTIVNPGPGAVYNNGAVAAFSNIFRSASSGLWSNSSTWQLYNDSTSSWLSTVLTPTSTSTVTISTGDTVVINSQAGVGILTIDSGAVLKSTTNAYTAASVVLSIGGTNAVIQNNGTFGTAIGSADSTVGDGIALSIASTCSSLSITGTGTTGIASMYPVAGSNNLSIVIAQNVQFRKSSPTSLETALSLKDPADVTSTGSRTLVINSGTTVSFLDSNSCLHDSKFSGTVGTYNAQQGNITYNIQGILNLNGGNVYISSTNNDTSSTQKILVNIGATGQLIAGGDFDINKAQATQSVYVNIEDGGLLDASTSAVTKGNSFGQYRNCTVPYSPLSFINSNATITFASIYEGYYTSVPTVTISGITGGSGLTATAVLTGNAVTSIVLSGGNGQYTGTPVITVSPSTVGGLAWVVMDGINASYKRLCGSTTNNTQLTNTFNIAVPPSSGDYSNIYGNPIQLTTQLSWESDVYTVGVAVGTPSSAPITNISPAYTLNRTWKIIPARSYAYGTNFTFGFTGGSVDANSIYSPTLPSVTLVQADYNNNTSAAIPVGSTDVYTYNNFTGKWGSQEQTLSSNAPTPGTFGTTWQFANTGVYNAFAAPYYFTLKNTAAPLICH